MPLVKKVKNITLQQDSCTVQLVKREKINKSNSKIYKKTIKNPVNKNLLLRENSR